MTHQEEVFQFRITLKDVEPRVWRWLEVPAIYSFWDLHVAIQDAMGWEDRHLHVFRLDDRETGRAFLVGLPTDRLIESSPVTLPGWEYSIATYFSKAGISAEYEYDFGDGWQHEILLQNITLRIVGKNYPVCLGGARACPPEDCGGVPGFAEILEIVCDPEHEQHTSVRERLGGDYDPDAFDPQNIEFDDPEQRWQRAFGAKQGQ